MSSKNAIYLKLKVIKYKKFATIKNQDKPTANIPNIIFFI